MANDEESTGNPECTPTPDDPERQHAPEDLNDEQRLVWANHIVNAELTHPVPQPPRPSPPRPTPPGSEDTSPPAGPSRFTGMLERLLDLDRTHDEWERKQRSAGPQP